jgi:Coenzyme PQQ synthesis protein D (PqqD)
VVGVWEAPRCLTVVGREPAAAREARGMVRALTRRPAVDRRLDGDRVLIDVTGKAMYLLNSTAWTIWELCDGQRSADQIVRELVRRYQVEEAAVGPECLEVLRALQAAELVVEVDR